MNLTEIKGIGKKTEAKLREDGWNALRLATASEEQLAAYGIPKAAAREAIRQARNLIHTERLAVSAAPPTAPRGLYLAPPDQPLPAGLQGMGVAEMEAKFRELAPGEALPAMAVRVRRNWLRNRLAVLMRDA